MIESMWRIFPQEQRSTDKRFVQTVIRGNLEKIPVIALNKSRRKDFILTSSDATRALKLTHCIFVHAYTWV